MSITLFTKFPDFNSAGFNEKEYYSTYINTNVLINASSQKIEFPVNPGGPLSIKHVFKGAENYIVNNRKYTVSRNNFLVFNEFQKYSSNINSKENTESFSVFFRPDYARDVLASLLTNDDKILESPFYLKRNIQRINFIETLYPNDNIVVPMLTKLRNSISNDVLSESYYSEQLYFLLEGLISVNRSLYSEINKVQAVRISTKLEIFRRLRIARDYMESSLDQKITLQDIAKASCMCEHHLLREFRKFYKLTPYQFLIKARLTNSKILLSCSNRTISEISNETGFEYLSSFSEAFYKYFKLTPSAYRQSSKSQL